MRGDRRDRRCAFSTKFDEPGTHSVVILAAHWCFGCGFYVCDRCNATYSWVGPEHDLEVHQPDDAGQAATTVVEG